MTRLITIGLIWGILVLVVVWDIIAAIDPTPRDTFSQVSLEHFVKHPCIPFALGILMGHLSWPMDYPDLRIHYWWYSLPVVILLVVVMVVLDMYEMICFRDLPVIVVLVGIAVGHFGWPQKLSEVIS